MMINLVSDDEEQGIVPKKRAGLFEDVTEGSKRERKSRFIAVNGYAVLRENNYDLKEGFISVYDGGEFQTGNNVGLNEIYDSDDEDYEISAGGKVQKKNQIIKIKEPKLKNERIIKPVISIHKSNLRDDHELSEKQRLLFVARNLEVFKEFLSFGFLKKIENLDQKEINNIKLPFILHDQPTCISKNAVLMRDYQLEGVNFMLKMFQSGMSCVLADEMGLGKIVFL